MDHFRRYLAPRIALAALVGLVALGLFCGAAAPLGCVNPQAIAANALSTTWNRVARPAVLAAFERAQNDALHAVCPADASPGACDRAAGKAAILGVRVRWAPALASLEQARHAHDAWRAALERCQAADGGGCPPALDELAGAFARALAAWRCDVRALGRPDLDRLASAPPVCEPPTDHRDGGFDHE